MLIEIDGWIKFQENKIAPICLPDQSFRDIPKTTKSNFKAFTAGWGALASPDAGTDCITNEFGPAPNTVCNGKYMYNGQKFENSLILQRPITYVLLSHNVVPRTVKAHPLLNSNRCERTDRTLASYALEYCDEKKFAPIKVQK